MQLLEISCVVGHTHTHTHIYIYMCVCVIRRQRVKFRIRWRQVVKFTPRPLPPQEELRYPLNRGAGWAPEPFWTFREEKNSLSLLGFEPGQKCRRMVCLSCWKTQISWLGVSLNSLTMTDNEYADDSITIVPCLDCSLHAASYCGSCCLRHRPLPLLEVTVVENLVLETKIKNTNL
jgi:hypothetical protein